MSHYLNPETGTKTAFITRVGGQKLPKRPNYEDTPAGHVLVVLVDNHMFDAAAVVDSPRDYEGFSPNDRRPTTFYWVPAATLLLEVQDNPRLVGFLKGVLSA